MPHIDTNRILPTIEEVATGLDNALSNFKIEPDWKDVGTVTSVLAGLVYVEGLSTVGLEELVKFEDGSIGVAFDISKRGTGCLPLSMLSSISAGMEVESTGELVSTLVGNELLGRVVNPLGEALDGKGPMLDLLLRPIEGDIPGILDRAPVSEPLDTGIKVVDALIPIGKGQRELILGDRQTGKTSIALDTIINQKGKNVKCIYCSIGQRTSAVAGLISILEKMECMDYTTVMVAEGGDLPGLRYIAPYAAAAQAEYFMERGDDVLVVYDDLTNHARTYREISLLLRRPPGREAFPGDVFCLHARLLERATHLAPRLGGGSMTAMPIIETQMQDISAYIPTNLISITDGQIYLSSDLYQKNILPAVDIGRSVSRVGGRAQLPVLRHLTGDLKLSYAQFEELESFARFGTRIDPASSSILEHGKRIRHCLTQPRYEPIGIIEQILVLLALKEGLFDRLAIGDLEEAELLVRSTKHEITSAICSKLLSRTVFNSGDLIDLVSQLKEKLRKWSSTS